MRKTFVSNYVQFELAVVQQEILPNQQLWSYEEALVAILSSRANLYLQRALCKQCGSRSGSIHRHAICAGLFPAFKMHKIIFFPEKNNLKKICVPTLP